MAHLALDCFGGMRPAALVMRIVIGPEKVVGQIIFQREIEADWVFLERCESVGAKILTRKHLEPRQRPHVMLAVRLVHRAQSPRDPSDARLDRAEAKSGKTLEHAGAAKIRNRLDGR